MNSDAEKLLLEGKVEEAYAILVQEKFAEALKAVYDQLEQEVINGVPAGTPPYGVIHAKARGKRLPVRD